jgi:hypothetical protein
VCRRRATSLRIPHEPYLRSGGQRYAARMSALLERSASSVKTSCRLPCERATLWGAITGSLQLPSDTE